MKRTITNTLLALAACSSVQAQTPFLTGQTAGSMAFVDTPVDSVTTVCAPFGSEHYYWNDTIPLDVDGDAVTDIVLRMDAVNEHGITAKLAVNGMNGGSIALGARTPYKKAAKVPLGVVIDASMDWSSPMEIAEMIFCDYGFNPAGLWVGPTQAYICVRTGAGNYGWVKIGILHPQPYCYTLFLYEYAAALSPVAVPEPASSAGVTVFPNPTHGDIHLSGAFPGNGLIDYQLVDATGRTVLNGQQTQSQGNEDALLDMAGLVDGIYFLHLQNGKQSWIQKVLKY